jgi:hypothetical protein
MRKPRSRQAERVGQTRPAIPPRRSERTFPAWATLQGRQGHAQWWASTAPNPPLLTAPAKFSGPRVDTSFGSG